MLFIPGEVLHTYRCMEVTAKAMESEFCYDALPVEPKVLVDGKQEVLRMPASEVSKDNSTEPRWFLEPLTHRLTTIGIRRPCFEEFVGKFKNSRGEWIRVTPALEHALAPADAVSLRSIHLQRNYSMSFSENLHDYSKGGIYSDNITNNYNDQLDRARRVEAWANVMMDNSHPSIMRSRPGQIHPSSLFPNLDLSLSWTSGLWGWFQETYTTFGTFWAVVFGVYSCYCILKGLVGMILKACMLKDTEETFLQMLYQMCCFSVVLAREYRKTRISDMVGGGDGSGGYEMRPQQQRGGAIVKKDSPPAYGGDDQEVEEVDREEEERTSLVQRYGPNSSLGKARVVDVQKK